jgi:cell division protein FtsZ
MRQAEEGVEALQKMVDTLIIIPNQNLFRLANDKTTFTEAFSMADDVLYQGVKGVTDLMVRPGLINLDFADVRAVMDEMGKAMMGTGEADGENRAVQAAEKAIANPLLDEISLRGARGVLINITGGHDLTLFELDEAANRIREEVDPDANIIVGSTLDTAMEGRMRVSVVATGIDASEGATDIPVPRRSLAEPLRQPEAIEAELHAEHGGPAQTEEPSLFDRAGEAPARQDESDSFAAQTMDDDLPPPAYQPRAEESVGQAGMEIEDELDAFLAPRAPAPGTPSPEALQRLHAAVRNAPSQAQRQQQPHEPEFAPVRAAHETGATAEERSRFGINSLINRMTGHGGHEAPRPARQQPPVQSAARSPQPAPREHDEEDQIEIPAFLRRQAN